MGDYLKDTRYCPDPFGLHSGETRHLTGWHYAGLCQQCYKYAVNDKRWGADPALWRFTCSTGDFSTVLAIDFMKKDQLREHRRLLRESEKEMPFDFVIAGYTDREDIDLRTVPGGDPLKAAPVYILKHDDNDGSTGTIFFGDKVGFWYPLPADKFLFDEACKYIESSKERTREIITLKLGETLTVKEICERVGVKSNKTVYNHWNAFKDHVYSMISRSDQDPDSQWERVVWNLRKRYVLAGAPVFYTP